MGLLTLDYFRCEAFELNFRLNMFGGFWPLKTDIRWKQILFSIYSFLCYFSITSMIIIQIVDIYLLRNDPVNLTKDLCSITMSIPIVTKSMVILYKVDLVNYLKEKFTEYKNTRTDSSDIEILENSNKQILMVIKTFYMLTGPCCVFWLLYPGLDSAEKRVPFPYRLPVEEWTFPIYVGVYVYQAFSMVGFMINTLSVDGTFCGFVLRISAHYDIVIKNIKALGKQERCLNMKTNEEEIKTTEKILKENIKLHQQILWEIKMFEDIYSSSCLLHFASVITIIGTAIIDFVRIAKEFKLQIVQKLLYVAVALWDTFLYCFFVTKLQQKSLELSRATYEAHWYNMPGELRKSLMFVSFSCQKVPRVKVAHLFDINLKVFLNLLKFSYDITALLLQTVKE